MSKQQTFIPDYHFCCNKKTSKEEREKLNIGDIWINAAVCLECKDYIRSLNKHHMATCSCGSISVDGGSWYSKRSGDPSKYVGIYEQFGDVEDEETTNT